MCIPMFIPMLGCNQDITILKYLGGGVSPPPDGVDFFDGGFRKLTRGRRKRNRI